MTFGSARLFDTRKSRRRVDDAGKPVIPPHGKHVPFPGMRIQEAETFRFGSIMSRGPGNAGRGHRVRRPGPNPAVRFTPNGDALSKADHTKAVQM